MSRSQYNHDYYRKMADKVLSILGESCITCGLKDNVTIHDKEKRRIPPMKVRRLIFKNQIDPSAFYLECRDCFVKSNGVKHDVNS